VCKVGVLILSVVLLLLAGCQQVPTGKVSGPPPSKIARLNGISSQPDGATVEFTGWLINVLGDDELGLELNLMESPDVYPQALVDLKSGQPQLTAGQYVCVRGRIMGRDDTKGATVYRIKDGEIIACY
jgi:starvation-inducible outer membrane lipoprotein